MLNCVGEGFYSAIGQVTTLAVEGIVFKDGLGIFRASLGTQIVIQIVTIGTRQAVFRLNDTFLTNR